MYKVDPIDKLAEIMPLPASIKTGGDDIIGDLSEVDITALNFAFPCCAISKSAKEFVNHLYATLGECSPSTNPSTAVQLFHLAKNMVDLFCAVLSSHHSNAIAELPQVAAVQHNNCMYLAHRLITLSH